MSKAAAETFISPIIPIARSVEGALMGGDGGGPPPVADPSKAYLAKPRAAGSKSEGRARDVLEDEKRRQYKAYADSLLGSAAVSASQSVGDPSTQSAGEGAY